MSRTVLITALTAAAVTAAAIAHAQPQVRATPAPAAAAVTLAKQAPLRRMTPRAGVITRPAIPPIATPNAPARSQMAQALTGAAAPPAVPQTIHLSSRSPVAGKASIDFHHAFSVWGSTELVTFADPVGFAAITVPDAGAGVSQLVVCAVGSANAIEFMNGAGQGGTATTHNGQISFVMPANAAGTLSVSVQNLDPGAWALQWCEVSRIG